MNQTIARIGSITVAITVALFAIFLLVSDFGSYVVCIFLALGYLLMIAGFHNESCKERRQPQLPDCCLGASMRF